MDGKDYQGKIIDLIQKGAPDQLAPVEIAAKAKAVGIGKSGSSLLNIILLGIAAGVFIGFGAMLATVATTSTGLGFGLNKLIGGLVFCLGLILVVLAGAELFTGNNLLTMGWLSGKISTLKLLKNWVVVYFANFVGALSLVVLVFYTMQWGFNNSAVGINAIQVASAKVNLSFTAALTRGILCNALVCLAVWLCFSARTVVDKIMAIIFPITAFVAAGFEHSVANMYFIPMGILLAKQEALVQAAGLTGPALANLSIQGLVNNLVPVTIGNIIGGGVLVGGMYWMTYLRQDRVNFGTAIRQRMGIIFTKTKYIKQEEVVAAPNNPNVILREALAKSLLVRYKSAENTELNDYSTGLREFLAKAVLAKVSGDDGFFKKLSSAPQDILKDYELTTEEARVLSGGNTEWLESKISNINDPLGTWVMLKLNQNRSNN